MRLLNSLKNDLFDNIESISLSPAQFEFEDARSTISEFENTTRLIFKNSEYYFAFESLEVLGETKHYALYSPGDTTFSTSKMSGSWQNQLHNFYDWLTFLNREITIPDKWKRLQHEINDLTINFENEENKFTAQEFIDLTKQMQTLKAGVLTLSLPSNQSEVINAKLDHLINLAEDMNKFDWNSLFIGTIISIIIQLSVTQENAKLLWDIIKFSFSKLLQ